MGQLLLFYTTDVPAVVACRSCTLYDEGSHLVNMTLGLKSGERREPRSNAVRRSPVQSSGLKVEKKATLNFEL
jgi:hypothetical protein